MNAETESPRGLIAFFARNPVAANLLMAFILIMGLVSYFSVQRQMFPNVEINYIHINAAYPGASPQEIEESILIKIEEALKDVTEIKRMIARAYRNSGRVSLEIEPEAELTDVLDKVNLRVDGIATFPAGMEPVNIFQQEHQQQVIEMSLVGDLPLTDLKPIAKQIEGELLELANVALVSNGSPASEIAIEIKPEELRKYSLSLDEVAEAVRRYSTNMSAGQLRSDAGLISVRVESQYYSGSEFRNIPVKIGQNGARVLLQDVATIQDGFTEGEYYFSYSGQNAIYMSVNATKEQNIIPVAESVKNYIEERNKTLPEGLELKVLVDMTYYLNARLDMMLVNLLMGAILVAIMLGLFLQLRLAFWVMVGLPVCFLGAVMLMPVVSVSINVISLFAFIMVLGIVVDDAIVIGESAYSEIEKHGGGTDNVVRGAHRVAVPATFGVLTTIAVFVPFLMSSGPEGAFFFNIAVVVILCLIFSLVESKLILPSHIAHMKVTEIKSGSWRDRFNKQFFGFIHGPYRDFVGTCTHWRWTVLAVFVALLMISIGLIKANHIRTVATPSVPHDFPSIHIEMIETVSEDAMVDALRMVESAIIEVDEQTQQQTGQPMIRDLLVFNENRNEGQLVVPLVDEELRPYDTFELSRRWRLAIPSIPGMKSFSISDDLSDGGNNGDFGYLIFGSDIELLNAAGRELITKLQQENGLYDISSTIDPASKEIQLVPLPVAYDLGLDTTSIARQVGNSFYGGEAQRLIRDGEEIRVMVRYPKLTRESFAELRYTVLTTPTGQEVLLGDVAELRETPGISYIRRESGLRSVYVWGAIDEDLVEPGEAVKRINENILPGLKQAHPSIKTELGGTIEETQAQQNEQIMFMYAGLIMVYILLAVPLKSYFQPIIIMSVIPFSFTGAIWGHFFFGINLSVMSTFGLIAAAGVVINDSLVFTDFVNKGRERGLAVREAVIQAGCARFRAITLTSITTFVGVLPIMFETSMQAKLVIPMAVALGFSVLYATLVTLILVPSFYIILQDIGNVVRHITAQIFKSINRARAQS